MDKQYTISENDFNDFIGNYLNSRNSGYAAWVNGVKLFKEYLEEKDSDKPVDKPSKEYINDLMIKVINDGLRIQGLPELRTKK